MVGTYVIVNKLTQEAKLCTCPPDDFFEGDWKARLPHVAHASYEHIICERIDGITGYDAKDVPCCYYSSELVSINGAGFMIFCAPEDIIHKKEIRDWLVHKFDVVRIIWVPVRFTDFFYVDFQKKLAHYTSAYSPLHEQFVRILRVRADSRGNPILDTLMNGREMIFRPHELTRFTI